MEGKVVEALTLVPGTHLTVPIKADRPGVYMCFYNVLGSHRHGVMVGKLTVDGSG